MENTDIKFIKKINGLEFYSIKAPYSYGHLIEFAGLDADDMYTFCGKGGEALVELSYHYENGMKFIEPANIFIPEKKLKTANLELIAEEAINTTTRVA